MKPFGYLGLVLAELGKAHRAFSDHVRVLLGTLHHLQGGITALRTLVAAGHGVERAPADGTWFDGLLPSQDFQGKLLLGGVGAALYFVVAQRLGVEEAGLLVGILCAVFRIAASVLKIVVFALLYPGIMEKRFCEKLKEYAITNG